MQLADDDNFGIYFGKVGEIRFAKKSFSNFLTEFYKNYFWKVYFNPKTFILAFCFETFDSNRVVMFFLK